MSGRRGTALPLAALSPAKELLADRGYDSNRYRAALLARDIAPCIPSTKNRQPSAPAPSLPISLIVRDNLLGKDS